MKVTIREATLDDYEIIHSFERELINVERPLDPYLKKGDISYYDIKDFIQDSKKAGFIAHADGVAAGCIVGEIRNNRDECVNEKFGYLGLMFVSEKFRKVGIGRKLVDELLTWFKEKGLAEVQLSVYEKNPTAIAAYEKMGFDRYFTTMRCDL